MKVVYVLPISWGGIPHYTAELANAISKFVGVIVIKYWGHYRLGTMKNETR